MSRPSIEKPDAVVERERRVAERNEKKAVRIRHIANSLLSNPDFVDWAGDMMVKYGYFDGREHPAFEQGLRCFVVREFGTLMENAVDGSDFLGKVFKDKVMKGMKDE